MATALDAILVPTATRMLAQFGKLVTLIFPSGSDAYNPSTGVEADPSPISLSVKCTPPSPAMLKYFKSEDVVARSDTVVFVAGADLNGNIPSTKMTVTIDAKVWSVVAVQAWYSGEQVALWGLALGATNV